MVKCAEPAEAEKILSFYHKLINDMAGTAYKPKWEKGVYPTLEELETAAEEGNLFYMEQKDCEQGGTVIGAFILNHDQSDNYYNVLWTYKAAPEKTAVLHLLATAANMQGRGIGKKLLSAAVEICRSRGDSVIRLDTLTWNIPGQKLYERFGFHCCGDAEMDYPTTGRIPFRMYEYKV